MIQHQAFLVVELAAQLFTDLRRTDIDVVLDGYIDLRPATADVAASRAKESSVCRRELSPETATASGPSACACDTI
jgi:hypothetical protein